jgi:hypothetical protein
MTDQINTNTNDDMFLSLWLDDNEVTNIADTCMNMNAPAFKPSSKSKSRATKKEDDGRPRRPRSSYNFFFQMQREAIMKQQKQVPIVVHKSMRNKHRIGKHANVGFENLARLVGENWRKVDPALKKDLERQARLDKERYEREMKAWYASRGETCVETSSKVDAVKVDDVTQTEGSLDFFSAAVAFVTPDVAPKTIVSNANANAASSANGFPALPFKDNASGEGVSKAVSTSPLSFTMCAPCNSNVPSAGDVSPTTSSSASRATFRAHVELMMTGSMMMPFNANPSVRNFFNEINDSQNFNPQQLLNAGRLVYDQYQSFIVHNQMMHQHELMMFHARQEQETRLRHADFIRRMEMHRRRDEDEDTMDVLRGLYNSRSSMSSASDAAESGLH